MSRRLLLGPDRMVLHDSADRDTASVQTFTGWDDSAGVNAVTVPNTGGHGVRAAGMWTAKEKYPTLGGRLDAVDRAGFEAVRSRLLAACPLNVEVELIFDDDDVPAKRMFVRRYDAATIVWMNRRWAAWTLPLVAADPFKYPTVPVEGTCGVFVGESWYRVYDRDTATARVYTLTGGQWVRTFTRLVPPGLPDAVQLVSDGDQVSERLTVTVKGPLAQGSWLLTNTVTGEQMYADLPLSDRQELVFDCYEQTATLNGVEDVTALVFGDWLTLPPGASTFQLVGGTRTAASATFSGLPASE